MNNLPTLPPERDLRPATRERQRAELTAIVEHESATSSHSRRLVPLAAAAAVVLIAGVAIAVPALRPDNAPSQSQPPVSGSVTASSSPIERLNEAELAAFGRKCTEHDSIAQEIVDGFRYTNPPADAAATTWVLAQGAGLWINCGFDKAGNWVTGTDANLGQPMYGAVQPGGMGVGIYLKSVTRITVTPLQGEAVDAVLRNGFYFAPVRKLQMNVEGPATTLLPYVTRGYDAKGKLVYTSPATVGERSKKEAKCYSDPLGKSYVWSGTSRPTPAPKDCIRTNAWDGRPGSR
jgi:hypothetical protein